MQEVQPPSRDGPGEAVFARYGLKHRPQTAVAKRPVVAVNQEIQQFEKVLQAYRHGRWRSMVDKFNCDNKTLLVKGLYVTN